MPPNVLISLYAIHFHVLSLSLPIRLTRVQLLHPLRVLVRSAGSTSMVAVESALTGERDGLSLTTITYSTTRVPT